MSNSERLAEVRALLRRTREDLVYHSNMESEVPDYRTSRGWVNLEDLLDELEEAIA